MVRIIFFSHMKIVRNEYASHLPKPDSGNGKNRIMRFHIRRTLYWIHQIQFDSSHPVQNSISFKFTQQKTCPDQHKLEVHPATLRTLFCVKLTFTQQRSGRFFQLTILVQYHPFLGLWCRRCTKPFPQTWDAAQQEKEEECADSIWKNQNGFYETVNSLTTNGAHMRHRF